MLTHPTVDKLHQLRCAGMAKALAEQLGSSEVETLAFEERLGLIVDRELTERASRQLSNRLRARPAAPPGLHRGHRLPPTPRPRQGPRAVARRRALDPRPPQCPHHRPGRRGKELDIVRPRPQRVPQWIQRLVPAPAAAADRAGHRARRRTLCQAAGLDRQDQRPRYRRLTCRSTSVVSRFLSWNPPMIWPDCSGDGLPGMTEQSGHLAVAMEVSATAVV